MSEDFIGNCRNCNRPISQRPCPFCGGTNIAFSREMVEPPIEVSDTVTRTVEGIRFRTDRYALFALIVIVGFQIFFLINSEDTISLIIELTLGFLIFLAGFFSINRIENMLRITIRRILGFNERNIQQNQARVNIRCNTCRNWYDGDPPCPFCGNSGSLIVGVVNETIEIPEHVTAVRRNHFSRINYFGVIFLAIILILQSYLTINFGGISELVITHIFGFLTFIPSYYAFLKIHFRDTEEFS